MLWDSIFRRSPKPDHIPYSHFWYYSIWSVIRWHIMTTKCVFSFFLAQGNFSFFQSFSPAGYDWLERLHGHVNMTPILAAGISAPRTAAEVPIFCGVCECVCVVLCTHTVALIWVCDRECECDHEWHWGPSLLLLSWAKEEQKWK